MSQKSQIFSQSPIYRLRTRNIRRKVAKPNVKQSTPKQGKSTSLLENVQQSTPQLDRVLSVISEHVPQTLSRSPIISEAKETPGQILVNDAFENCPVQHVCLICQEAGQLVEMNSDDFCVSCGIMPLCPTCKKCSFCHAEWLINLITKTKKSALFRATLFCSSSDIWSSKAGKG